MNIQQSKDFLLVEIEDLRFSLTKLVHQHQSFIHNQVIEHSRKLDEKLLLWQKYYSSNKRYF